MQTWEDWNQPDMRQDKALSRELPSTGTEPCPSPFFLFSLQAAEAVWNVALPIRIWLGACFAGLMWSRWLIIQLAWT